MGDECACLVLGDNIFYGQGFRPMLEKAVKEAEENQKATVFGYYVNDPERYVWQNLKTWQCAKLEEKPSNPKSNYAW
jgi:glucose-1-phosphate thymidylyltransferase